jgi:hypothetical protein
VAHTKEGLQGGVVIEWPTARGRSFKGERVYRMIHIKEGLQGGAVIKWPTAWGLQRRSYYRVARSKQGFERGAVIKWPTAKRDFKEEQL